MRICIEIGHPGHVHYFKNFIWQLEKNGHKIKVVAKGKEFSHHLLEHYGIPFESLGPNRPRLLQKGLSILEVDLKLLRISKKFKPDIFISRLSPHSGHISKLLSVPHIAFSDTEHAWLSDIISIPFTDVVITPSSYLRDLGEKQIRYEGFTELAYLHPNYFTPDPSVLELLNVDRYEKYVIIRFVSWSASHDFGHSGMGLSNKMMMVNELLKYSKVFITSEAPLPFQLEKYRLRTPPHMIHDVLNYATLYIGEGATMASECACLATPAIYVNYLSAGVLEELENKFNMIISNNDVNNIIENGVELLLEKGVKEKWERRRKTLLAEKIDVTSFMFDFIDNFQT